MSGDETPPKPTIVSAKEAARRIDVSPATMGRYLEQGRVSFKRRPDGNGYLIDLSDLYRAFPDAWKKLQEAELETAEQNGLEQSETPDGTPRETGSAALKTEIRMLREMLERANLDLDRERRTASDAVEDYRRRLDDEARERRALAAQLLTYQQPPAPPAAPTPPVSPTPSARGGIRSWFRKAS